jgi:hypothetical protein
MQFCATVASRSGEKTVLFCTYAIRQGSTLKILEKELAKKGYETILSVSKRGFKMDKTDFSDILAKVKEVLRESV